MIQILLWILQGLVVGIGVILPGVSGGSLLYAFGIYNQILEVLSSPLQGIRKHFKMLCFVALGGACGFIGFAGVTAALLAWNSNVVICAFVGLIIGTLPGLWRDAGQKGRGKASWVALACSFVGILLLFYAFENWIPVFIPQNLLGWIICGLIWGLGFVVPGLASSNLLMFFGLYEPLLGHIKALDLSVLLPFGLAVLAVFFLLSRAMAWVFDRYHSLASHCIIGFVVATTVMILPLSPGIGFIDALLYLACLVVFALLSYGFTRLLPDSAEKG